MDAEHTSSPGEQHPASEDAGQPAVSTMQNPTEPEPSTQTTMDKMDEDMPDTLTNSKDDTGGHPIKPDDDNDYVIINGKKVRYSKEAFTELYLRDERRKEELSEALNPRGRGRPVSSGVGVKRKADAEYSDNQNTQKVRRRLEGMSETQKEVERAKAADNQAVNRAKKTLEKTEAFKQMSEAEKVTALEKSKSDTLRSRSQAGYSQKLVVDKLATHTSL